jgi:hypothetical protein
MGVKKLVAGSVVTALATAGLAFGTVSPAAAAKKPPITASGGVLCSGSGKIKAYSTGNAPNFQVFAAVKARLGCAGSTGDPNVVPTSAALKLTLPPHQGGCDATGVHGSVGLALKWRATGGKLVGSYFGSSNTDVTTTGWEAPGAGGTGNVQGSYNTSASPHLTVSSNLPGAFFFACGNPKGQKYKGTVQISLAF